VKLDVEVKGLAKAVASIEGLAIRSRSLGPLRRGFEEIVNRSAESRFRSQGGGAWPPLSPDTLRQRQGSGDRMLVDTGALLASLTHKRAEVSEDELRASPTPDVPYARFVNYGTVNMPARKLSDLRPSERREAAALVSLYVAKGRT
jgi:hypothetical protein